MNLKQISLTEIDQLSLQPRTETGGADLDSLAASLQLHGMLTPVLVAKSDGRFILVNGQRRCSAAARLGWKEVPAVVLDELPDDTPIKAYAENDQRVSLSPVEEGRFFMRLMEEQETNAKGVAGFVQKSAQYVEQRIDAVGWPEWLRSLLGREKISFSAARELGKVDLAERAEAIALLAEGEHITAGLAKLLSAGFGLEIAGIVVSAVQGKTVVQAGSGGSVPMLKCQFCQTDWPVSSLTPIMVCPPCLGNEKAAVGS